MRCLTGLTVSMFLLFKITQTNCETTTKALNRDPESQINFINFAKPDESKYLLGDIISRSFEPEELDCLFKCFKTEDCLSLNVASSAEPSNSRFWCELLPIDKFNSSAKFNENGTSKYYSIYSPCHYINCNYGACVTKYDREARSVMGTCVCEHGHVGPHCQQECISPLGMESRAIPDDRITASSKYDGVHHFGYFARLNNLEVTGVTAGCWSAKDNNVTQWLQIDLGVMKIVTRVATQGRPQYDQWVTSYKLKYSLDGSSWSFYQEGNPDKVFQANSDMDTVVTHNLIPHIEARYVRFLPMTWHWHISMRCELYGCVPPP